MGNSQACCCSNDRMGNQGEITLTPLGQDEEGITEDYQYHESYVRKNKLKLSQFDKFYRKTTQPMNYIKINDFFQ